MKCQCNVFLKYEFFRLAVVRPHYQVESMFFSRDDPFFKGAISPGIVVFKWSDGQFSTWRLSSIGLFLNFFCGGMTKVLYIYIFIQNSLSPPCAYTTTDIRIMHCANEWLINTPIVGHEWTISRKHLWECNVNQDIFRVEQLACHINNK